MDILTATMICEGVEEADQETQLEAWQLLVDSGVVWQLQGSFGRMANELINQGLINPPVIRKAA